MTRAESNDPIAEGDPRVPPAGAGSEVTGENAPEQRTITPRESSAILLSSVVAAVSALAATVIAARGLGPVQTAEFVVFWSLLFGIYGIVAGIQQETTRAVGSAQLTSPPEGTGKTHSAGTLSGVRVAPVAAGFGLAVAALVAGTSPLWAPHLLPSGTAFAVTVICLGVALYSLHSSMSGAAAGRQSWFVFAGLGGGEAAMRMVVMLAVALIASSIGGLQAAAVSPVLVWMGFALFSRSGRAAFLARADVGAGQLTRNILFAMGSSAASAVLMTGFPAVLRATEGSSLGDRQALVLGGLILAIGITRSPIMIPLQAFQGVAISAFLKQRHRPLAALTKPVGALLGIGVIGAAAAWLVGPWLFVLIYGTDYREVIVGWLLGALTFGSAVMALLVLSGTAVLALNAHRVYILGWVVAALVAIGLLFLPLDLIPRALIALYVGPALGFAVHLAGMVAVVRHRS